MHLINQLVLRIFQCPFWNISIFDKNFFDGIFKDFFFPDGTKADQETLNKLQQILLKWFNERSRALLTFPVVTVSVINDGNTLVDTEYKKT